MSTQKEPGSTVAQTHANSATAASVQTHHSNGTILLVEDDPALRRYLEVVLKRAGYIVIPAADGLEGMKAALAGEIDAVITDAVMPHLGGPELCRFIRRHPQLQSTPLILLSGNGPAVNAPDKDARADVYLAKPVRPEELTACVSQLLKK